MKSVEEYLLNVTEFPARNIESISKPDSISALKETIKLANKNEKPVYAISTGHNWGLGSKLPVMDSDIIDLSRLNRIVEVNESLAYARIQPGVTQIQLANYLKEHCPELMLNVTGSDAHSSILANAIERGSGKNGQRANDIRELTIINSEGKEFTTGFGSFSDHSNSFYKYGLGPDLTHLFTQSNFGIVTEGVINLMPKQPFNLYLGHVKHEDLGKFLEVFAMLVRKEIVGNSLEIDSQNDPKIFELFDKIDTTDQGWVCWFVAFGSEPIRAAKHTEIQETLEASVCDLKMYSSEKDYSSLLPPIQVRISRYSGIPNDHSLISTAKAFGVELDVGNPDLDTHKLLPGFRCVLPVIPFSKDGAKIIDLILSYSENTSFEPAISIIGLDHYALEVFARVYFNRTDEKEITSAGEWASGLLHLLKNEGIYPYRLDVENMIGYLSNVNDPFKSLKEVIKKHLDPKGIIAPGRYHLIS